MAATNSKTPRLVVEDLGALGVYSTYYYAVDLVYHAEPSPRNPRVSHRWLTVPQV